MTIAGALIMIVGIAALCLPLNDLGIVNLNAQFGGMVFCISGAVIFVGVLQGVLLEMNNRLPIGKASITPVNIKPESNPAEDPGYQLASAYAQEKGILLDTVIAMIIAKKLSGKYFGGYWYVERSTFPHPQ